MFQHGDSPPAGHSVGGLADFQDRTWRTGVFRGAAIAVLAASLTAAPIAILRAAAAWQLDYLLWLAFLVALMGIVSTGRLGRPDWRNRRGLAYRCGEIVLVLLAARLAVWAFTIGWPDLAALGVLLRHPLAFFDAQTTIVAGLLLAVWVLAISITADFAALAIQPDEVAAREMHVLGGSLSELRLARPMARGDIVARFTGRWAWGGLPVVICTGLSQLGMSQDQQGILRFGFAGMGLGRDVLAGLLCYFLAGLLLLSDARLASLRGGWYNERVAIAPSLLRRWHGRGLWVLVAVAGIALLLPLGPVEPLAGALEWLIALFVRIGLFLGGLLAFVASALLYPLRWLFLSGAESPPPAIAPLALPTRAEPSAQLLPDWLPGALTWAGVGLVAGYLLFNFLRGQGLLRGVWGGKLAILRFWWRARRGRAGAALRARVSVLRARLQRGRDAAPDVGRAVPVRFGVLPPRAKVRYFYLRMAQRAAAVGYGRQAHITPAEYARDLEAAWPEAEEDVQGLTAAFLDARYAAHEIGPDRARSAQAVWRRLMRALRGPAHGTGA